MTGRGVRRILVALGLCVGIGLSLSAAQAPVVNAVVEHQAVSGGVARTMDVIAQRGVPLWVGYHVSILRGRDTTLRPLNGWSNRCRLEPPTELTVLARFEARRLVELRPVPVDCDVDASGMTLVWLDDVGAADSVAWLATLLSEAPARPRGFSDSALMAIALHADRAADPVLVNAARSGNPRELRSRALFWLAQRAADAALPTIDAAIENDPDTQVKRQAVFALSQLPKDQGVPRLIELARSHRNPEVRRQAMFWLGQSNDPRATEFFEKVLAGK